MVYGSNCIHKAINIARRLRIGMPGWVAQQSADVIATNKMELSTHCARIARTCSDMAFIHGVRFQHVSVAVFTAGIPKHTRTIISANPREENHGEDCSSVSSRSGL